MLDTYEERRDYWDKHLATANILRHVLMLTYPEFAEMVGARDPRDVRNWFDGDRIPRDPEEIFGLLVSMDDEDTEWVGWVLDSLANFSDPASGVQLVEEAEAVIVDVHRRQELYYASKDFEERPVSYRRYLSRLDRLHIALRHEGYSVKWHYYPVENS